MKTKSRVSFIGDKAAVLSAQTHPKLRVHTLEVLQTEGRISVNVTILYPLMSKVHDVIHAVNNERQQS